MTESYDSGLLTGMLAQRGIDPSMLALLENNKGMFGSDGGLLFLLFLIILMGGGNGYGWGGQGGIGGVDRTVINEGNFNQLMQAVTASGQAQTAAVQTLANNLNTDASAVNLALAGLDKQLAVNNGDIKSAIQACCCNMRTELQSTSAATNLALERGFAGASLGTERACNQLGTQMQQLGFAIAQQGSQNTQSIINAITGQSAMIQDEFCALRNREDAKTIQDLRDKLAEQRDAANTQLILTALANKDTISTTIAGTLDSTAGTWTGTGTGTLS